MNQIEGDILEFLEKVRELTPHDRFQSLKSMFEKHLSLEKENHLLTMDQFQDIVNFAKGQYLNTTLPMSVSNREVSPEDVRNILMVESTVSFLNKTNILKRLVKIDYTTKTKENA